MISAPILSIVICTYNREELACGAITSVLAQDFPRCDYELLIVDNASKDHTREMSLEFCRAYPNVHYVFEPNVGLSHARNRGWGEGRGKYIGYLDDDAKAPSGWISVAMEVATQVAPEAFGGPYYAFYNSPKPGWFKDDYESVDLGKVSRPINSNEYLRGSNFWVRRDVLAGLKGFTSSLGMTGKKIAFGEETRFIINLREKYPGAIIYYEPRLFIYHLVRAEKMDLWRRPKRLFIDGQYSYRTQLPVIQIGVLKTIWEIVHLLVMLLKSCTWNLIRRDKKKYPHFKNFLYEQSFIYFRRLGRNMEMLSRTLKGN